MASSSAGGKGGPPPGPPRPGRPVGPGDLGGFLASSSLALSTSASLRFWKSSSLHSRLLAIRFHSGPALRMVVTPSLPNRNSLPFAEIGVAH